MLELMFFVFIILHTESVKIKILKETERQEQIRLQQFMLDLKQKPELMREFLEIKNNS